MVVTALDFACENSGKPNWSRLRMSWISFLRIYRLDGEPNAATVLLKDGYFYKTIAPDLEQISMGSGPSRSFLPAEDFRFNDRRRCPVRTDRA